MPSRIFKFTLCLIVTFSLLHVLSVVIFAQTTKRVLVKFSSKSEKQAIIAKHKLKVISEIPQIETSVLEIQDNKDALKNLAKEKIDYIGIDALATTLSNDTLYSNQWALPKISWDKLDATSSAYNPATLLAKIAIVDSGVDYTHPDLSGKVDTVNDWDFVNGDSDAMDDNLHGTHVAGIAASSSNNDLGIAGVSINTASILPIKVLNQSGSGYYSWIAQGIIYAADRGAKVINLSLGGNIKSQALENAVNYAFGKGAVVVAAAGNSGNSSKTYPGAYLNAMAVWASDQNDLRASFSSYGSWVDVGAPGVSILSTIPLGKDTKDGNQDGYYLGSGTSMATPHVSGLAGLLISQHPNWSASQVRSKIESTADPVSDRLFSRGYLGKGRINVIRALTQ